MIYRAAAAYPYLDEQLATAGLRGQLRVMALAGDASPDWSTLVVEGPTRAPGARGRSWYEWTATLSVEGGRDLIHDVADEDDLLASAHTAGPGALTMPQPRVVP